MSCPECVRCEADDCDQNAYCLSQPTAIYPCAHGRVLCDDHNLTHCPGCREDAEREMYRSGEYDPRADPFYLPQNRPADEAYGNRPPLTFPGSPGFRADKDSA